MQNKYVFLVVAMSVSVQVNAQYNSASIENINEDFDLSDVSSVDKSGAGSFPTLIQTGPFITSVGTGINGEDESVREDSLSMTTLGAAAQLSDTTTNNRVADDFEVVRGGWQIEEIEVYAYQTNEIASTITSVNMQIWDGIPGEPGSSVVFGDTTTNVLASTSNTGVLRVTEGTTGTVDDRQITANTVIIGQFFPEGTYWVDYQFTGSGSSGPWAPPITISGMDTTGDALQQINRVSSDWIPLVDGGSSTALGLPIVVRGTGLTDLIFENGFQNSTPAL